MSISIQSLLKPSSVKSLKALEGIAKSVNFNGSIDTSIRRQAARIMMQRHQERLGGVNGKVGVGLTDIEPHGNLYRKAFSGGLLNLLDFTDGPQGMEGYRGEVRFVGFRCHQQSEKESGDGDEVYFIVTVTGSNQDENEIKTFGDFKNTKSLTNTSVQKFVTKSAQPPIVISVVAMEADSGSKEEAAAQVQQGMNDAAAKLALTLPILGVDPTYALYSQALLNVFGDWLGKGISAFLGMGDDFVGENAVHILEFDETKKEWKTPPPMSASDFKDSHNIEIVLDNGEGGRYSAFFQVDLFHDTVVKV